jgi:hypothetical protein
MRFLSKEFHGKAFQNLYQYSIFEECTVAPTYYAIAEEVISANRNLWRTRIQLNGISPSDKCFCLHLLLPNGSQNLMGSDIIKTGTYLSVSVTWFFSGSAARIRTLIDQYRPTWLLLPTAAILYLYQNVDAAVSSNDTVVKIEYYGQRLDANTIAKISNRLNATLHYLFAPQVGVAAYEVSYGELEVVASTAMISFLDDKSSNEYKPILVTSLIHKAAPVIKHLMVQRGKMLSKNHVIFEGNNDMSLEAFTSTRIKGCFPDTVLHLLVSSVLYNLNNSVFFAIREFRIEPDPAKQKYNLVLQIKSEYDALSWLISSETLACCSPYLPINNINILTITE